METYLSNLLTHSKNCGRLSDTHSKPNSFLINSIIKTEITGLGIDKTHLLKQWNCPCCIPLRTSCSLLARVTKFFLSHLLKLFSLVL